MLTGFGGVPILASLNSTCLSVKHVIGGTRLSVEFVIGLTGVR